MNQRTITLPFKKETDNTLQFQAGDRKPDDCWVPTIYVKKTAFDKDEPWPDEITVTLDFKQ